MRTAGEMIQMHILREAMEASKVTWREPITFDNMDEAIEQLDWYDSPDSEWTFEKGDGIEMSDCEYEFKCGGEMTNIDSPDSRHYESTSRAAKLWDGTWVGWTEWYGGGKHGDPGAIPWMEDAYFVEVKEEEKLVTIRTFTEIEDARAN